jgi:hypothetical protein
MNTQNPTTASNNQFSNPENAAEDLNVLSDDSPIQPAAQSSVKKIIKQEINHELLAPVKKTDQNLDLLLRNTEEIDTHTKELMMKNRSLIQQLFPSKMDKLVAEMQRNTIHTAMEFRLNLYKMSTEFRLEVLREKYNAALMTVRALYRQQVSEFMIARLMELHQVVDTNQRSFIEVAKNKYDFARQQSGYPEIQSIYLNQIGVELNGFMNFLGIQIASFENIMNEQIKKFGS